MNENDLSEPAYSWLKEMSALLMVFPWLDQAIAHELKPGGYWWLPFFCWILAAVGFVACLLVKRGARRPMIYAKYLVLTFVLVAIAEALSSCVVHTISPNRDDVFWRPLLSAYGTVAVVLICAWPYRLISKAPEGTL